MARREVLVSDLSGREISPQEKASMLIKTGPREVEFDLTVQEAETFINSAQGAGTVRKRRGRPPKVEA